MTTSTISPPKATDGRRYLRWFVVALMVATGIYSIETLIALFTSDTLVSPLEWSVQPDDIVAALPDGASITEADALVDVEAKFGQRFFWWLVTDMLGVVFFAFLFLIHRILAKGTEPFTEQNAKRLRWLLFLSLFGAGISIARPFVSMSLQESFGFETRYFFMDFTDLLFVLIIAALLEVWRHGIDLRNEQELTV